jgi:predicted O-methyltransferase YrrM
MKFSSLISPPPFKARHAKRTFVSSPDDEASRPTRELIELTLEVVRKTFEVDVSDLCERCPPVEWVPDLWPGEHYQLLAGFVACLQPKTVVEIGTETGLSALCMQKYLPEGARVVTYDLIPWKDIEGAVLREEDLADGRLIQELGDLSDPEVFAAHQQTLQQADLIFADGPKDGRFEYAFAELLDTLDFEKPPLILFDDIRDRHMLRFWRELTKPKLDISSFGHWTGTGLVQWTNAT